MAQFTCQACGKEFRAPPSQKRKYCSLECADARYDTHRIIKPCLYCGKPVTIVKHKHDKGLGKFCSYSCRSRYYKPIPHPKGTQLVPRITVICEGCGRPFEATPGQLQAGRQFCSNACINVGRESPKKKERVQCTCLHCGGIFHKLPCELKNDRGQFCSRKCHGAYTVRHKFSNAPTSIEQALMDELDSRNIDYESQYPLKGWVIDFAFPSFRLAVEADGTYWHSLENVQRKDARKDADLTRRGWTVLRFTGDEIRASAAACVDEIVKHLT